MEATIKAIDPKGQWNGMDKKLVTMSTGEQYTFFVKQGLEFGYNVNDRIEFEVTNAQYNNAKPIRKKENYRPQEVSVGVKFTKDDLIMRQTAFKGLCEIFSRTNNIDLVFDNLEDAFKLIKYGK
jgi:hypothetical protein